MNEIILLKLGELVLKGLNRRSFEDKLQANIHRRLHPYGQFRVYTRQSATYVEPKDDSCDVQGAYEALTKVFGIAGLSLARPCEKDKDAILACARDFLDDQLRTARTFKVETKRADKSFPMTSIQLSQYVGGELHEAYDNLEVDVHHPELTVYIEVRDYAAYVHAQPQPGAGGLPVGINGRAVSLLSGGIDSPVAAYMMAKRGLSLACVHFASPPYTSERARMKVLTLAKKLTPYTGNLNVYVVPYTAAQEHIRDNAPEDLFTVLMRRSMMRITRVLCEKESADAIVTGESLAQVASQTLKAIACTDAAQSLPVLRPCIGMDKTEITDIARKIDTYETSILPYEDCCTIFTPPHPKTKPHLDEIEAAEAGMPGLAELEAQAAAQAEVVYVNL